MLAPCGIDCEICEIHLASANPELAERLANGFRKRVDPKAEPSWFHCRGCPGDRTDHWNRNCIILRCCVDNRNLVHCNQCPEFVCEELQRWARARQQHADALERLKQMLSS